MERSRIKKKYVLIPKYNIFGSADFKMKAVKFWVQCELLCEERSVADNIFFCNFKLKGDSDSSPMTYEMVLT